MVSIILLVFAFVLFVISCWSAAAPYWNRLVAAGLACWVLSILLGSVSGHIGFH